jgi:hypothetical protein
MAEVRLSFEERKFMLKCYWKYKNVTEVQREFTREFQRNPPTRRTIACTRDKFEATGTVQDVHKQRSSRPWSSTSPTREEQLLEILL